MLLTKGEAIRYSCCSCLFLGALAGYIKPRPLHGCNTLHHFLLKYLTLYLIADDAVVGKSSFSSKPQFSSGQTYGEKSEAEGSEKTESAREAGISLSEIEKKLLLLYPGESKHLDDSQVHTIAYLHIYIKQ